MENKIDQINVVEEIRGLNAAIANMLMAFNANTGMLIKSIDIHSTEMGAACGADYFIQVTSNVAIT